MNPPIPYREERKVDRNGIRNFVRETTGKAPTTPFSRPNGDITLPGFFRVAARTFCLWVFSQLSKGNCVELFGAGVIYARFRSGRNTNGGGYAPAQYVLKFKPSVRLKAFMRELARDDKTSHFGLPPISEMEKMTPEQRNLVERLNMDRTARNLASQSALETDEIHQPSSEPGETSPSEP